MKRKLNQKGAIDFKFLIIVIIIILGFALILININSDSDDTSYMSSEELVEFFEKEGYTFEISESSLYDLILFDNLNEEGEGIIITKTIGGSYDIVLFSNTTVNNLSANISDTSQNDTEDELEQYEAYEKWLEKYDLTYTKLNQMLKYYHEINT